MVDERHGQSIQFSVMVVNFLSVHSIFMVYTQLLIILYGLSSSLNYLTCRI